MYDVALSVLSCLRAHTAVHAAWIVAGVESGATESVAITPGGGRIGSLLGGALDHALTEALPGLGETGGLVDLSLGPVESLLTGLPEGTVVTIAIAPGSALPLELWETLAERRPVSFACNLEGRSFTGVEILDDHDAVAALTADRLTCVLVPIPRAVIVGGGPIADALEQGFALIGWHPTSMAEVGAAAGVMATLSQIDAIVVMGHDVELSGRALQGAIESGAGYIASIGSIKMQELRQEWLAFRGVKWDDRVHGPAGLPIGASTPGEIAVSIVAEAVASVNQNQPSQGT